MTSYRISAPKVHVMLFDGSEYDVQTTNAELNRWEDTAAKHKWPISPTDPGLPPATWYTFIAWAAMRREQLVGSDVTFDRFRFEVCKDVQAAADDDSTVDAEDRDPGVMLYGDPTRPARGAG